MRIDLGGPALEFVQLADPQYNARYAAEIDGVRVPIRLHRVYNDRGYGAGPPVIDDEQGMTMLLWDLCDLVGEPKREGDAFVFEIDIERHYRSYKKGRVRIVFTGGVVHWDAEIDEQLDSYY